MEYITAREAAVKWKVSQRRVQRLCEQSRVPGVLRFGTSWMIPSEADKPTDPRKNHKEGVTQYE